MSRDHAFIVALETYRDPLIGELAYAGSDARSISETLADLGVPRENQQVLVNGEATKTAVESRLRRTFERLKDGARLYVFLAGNGFSVAGENYIACHDSLAADLAATSLSLDLLARLVREAKGRRIILFLTVAPGAGQPPIDDRKLKHAIDGLTHCSCFVSCAAGQTPVAYDAKRHGLWTWALLRALRGEARETPGSVALGPLALQEFLVTQVQAKSRELRTDQVQTPWYAGVRPSPPKRGASSAASATPDREEPFSVAEMGADHKGQTTTVGDVESGKGGATPASGALSAGALKQVRMLGGRVAEVRKLPGFERGRHAVPDRHSSANEKFALGLAVPIIKSETEQLWTALREGLQLKRADLRVEGGEAAATLFHPKFTLLLWAEVHKERPDAVQFLYEIENISDVAFMLGEEFSKAVGPRFSRIRFIYKEKVAVDALIDALEKHDVPVKYDMECTWCDVLLPGVAAKLRVKSEYLDIAHEANTTPRALTESLLTVHRILQRSAMGDALLPPG